MCGCVCVGGCVPARMGHSELLLTRSNTPFLRSLATFFHQHLKTTMSAVVPVDRVFGSASAAVSALSDQRVAIALHTPATGPIATMHAVLNPEPWLSRLEMTHAASETGPTDGVILACAPHDVLAVVSDPEITCSVSLDTALVTSNQLRFLTQSAASSSSSSSSSGGGDGGGAVQLPLTCGRNPSNQWCVLQPASSTVPFVPPGLLPLRLSLSSPTGLRSASQRLLLPITDTNDNAPFIDTTTADTGDMAGGGGVFGLPLLAVHENVPAGTSCGSLSIVDFDTAFPAPAATITTVRALRSLSSEGEELRLSQPLPFRVSAVVPASTGTEPTGLYAARVETTATLDRETFAAYLLEVTLTDGTHTTVVPDVLLSVLDSNDNAPIVSAISTATCTDDGSNSNNDNNNSDGVAGQGLACGRWSINDPGVSEAARVGDAVAIVRASDADDPSSGAGRVFAALVTSSSLQCTAQDVAHFSLRQVGAYAWELVVQQQLDFESSAQLRLCIQLQDAGLPSLSRTVALTIAVDNALFDITVTSGTAPARATGTAGAAAVERVDAGAWLYSATWSEQHARAWLPSDAAAGSGGGGGGSATTSTASAAWQASLARLVPAGASLAQLAATLQHPLRYIAAPSGIASLVLSHNGEMDLIAPTVSVDDATTATAAPPPTAAAAAAAAVRFAHRIDPPQESDCVMTEWIALPVCFDAESGIAINMTRLRAEMAMSSSSSSSSSSLSSSTQGWLQSLESVLARNASRDIVRPSVRFVAQPRDVDGFGRDCPRYDSNALAESRATLASAFRSGLGAFVHPAAAKASGSNGDTAALFGSLYTLRFEPCIVDPSTTSSTSTSSSDGGGGGDGSTAGLTAAVMEDVFTHANATTGSVRAALDHAVLMSRTADQGHRNGFARNSAALDGWQLNGVRVQGDISDALAAAGEAEGGDVAQVQLVQTRASSATAALATLLHRFAAGEASGEAAGAAQEEEEEEDGRGESAAIDIYDGTWVLCDAAHGGASRGGDACAVSITTPPVADTDAEAVGRGINLSPPRTVLSESGDSSAAPLISVVPGMHVLEIAAEVNGTLAAVHRLPLLVGDAAEFAESRARAPCPASSQQAQSAQSACEDSSGSRGQATQPALGTLFSASPLASVSSVHGVFASNATSGAGSAASVSPSTLGRAASPGVVFITTAPRVPLTSPFALAALACRLGDDSSTARACSLAWPPANATCGADLAGNSSAPLCDLSDGDGGGGEGDNSDSDGIGQLLNDARGLLGLAAEMLGVAQGFSSTIAVPASHATKVASSARQAADSSGAVEEGDGRTLHAVHVSSSSPVAWACANHTDTDDAWQGHGGVDWSLPSAVAFATDDHVPEPFFVKWPSQPVTAVSTVAFAAACTLPAATLMLACSVGAAGGVPHVVAPCGMRSAADSKVFHAALPLAYGANEVAVACIHHSGAASPSPATLTLTVDADPPLVRVRALPKGCSDTVECVTNARRAVVALSANEPAELTCRDGVLDAAPAAHACCSVVIEDFIALQANGTDGASLPASALVLQNQSSADHCLQLCAAGVLFATTTNSSSGDGSSFAPQWTAAQCFGSASAGVTAHAAYSTCSRAALRESLVLAFSSSAAAAGGGGASELSTRVRRKLEEAGSQPGSVSPFAAAWGDWHPCNGSGELRAAAEAMGTAQVREVLLFQAAATDLAGNTASTATATATTTAAELDGAPFVSMMVDPQYEDSAVLDGRLLDALRAEAAAREREWRREEAQRLLEACAGDSKALQATNVLAGILCILCLLYLLYLRVTWDVYVERMATAGEKQFETTAPGAKQALQQAFELIHMSDLTGDGSFEVNPGFLDNATEEDLIANTSFLYGLGLHNVGDGMDDVGLRPQPRPGHGSSSSNSNSHDNDHDNNDDRSNDRGSSRGNDRNRGAVDTAGQGSPVTLERPELFEPIDRLTAHAAVHTSTPQRHRKSTHHANDGRDGDDDDDDDDDAVPRGFASLVDEPPTLLQPGFVDVREVAVDDNDDDDDNDVQEAFGFPQGFAEVDSDSSGFGPHSDEDDGSDSEDENDFV